MLYLQPCIFPSYTVLPNHTKQLHNHEKYCCSKVCQKFGGTPNLPNRYAKNLEERLAESEQTYLRIISIVVQYTGTMMIA